MRKFSVLATAAVAFLAVQVGGVQAASFSQPQKDEIGEIVRAYLLEHPDILREMSDKLDAQQKMAEDKARGSALGENADAIFKSAIDPVVGNPKGDVTMVEFMDYNCGWCKRSVGEVSKLLEQDKNLKVVFKEFPIFGEGSEYAARAALAATRQGKYWDLHRALFAHEGKVDAEVTDQLAEAQGIDMAQLKKDMEDPAIAGAIGANHALGQSLMITGTPAFIIDRTVVPGYLPIDGLQSEIDKVRKAGGCSLC